MTGFELDNRWQLHAKAWQRIRESAEHDDNPRIQDYIGRGEVKLGWNVNAQNYLGFTARGSLGQGRGSGRVEWLRTDRKSTRLNSSHLVISYAVFCLKK